MTRNSSIAKSHVTKDLHGKTHYRQNVIIATQTRKKPCIYRVSSVTLSTCAVHGNMSTG